jgi:hypothetical protein
LKTRRGKNNYENNLKNYQFEIFFAGWLGGIAGYEQNQITAQHCPSIITIPTAQ